MMTWQKRIFIFRSQRYRYDNNFLTKGTLPKPSAQEDMGKKEVEEEKHFEKLMLVSQNSICFCNVLK